MQVKTLERFNTIEQPKIETIMDSVEDNLEVTEETLKEVKKLFVISTKVPIPDIEISVDMKNKLKVLEMDGSYYRNLIDRRSVISAQLMGAMGRSLPPDSR